MTHPLRLTGEALRRIGPKASASIVEAFLQNQNILAKAGILDTPYRLAYCFANLAHETGDWRIRNLTENINYTHQRIHEVWPNRYSSAAAVERAFGSAPGWQKKAFDVIYGNRMEIDQAHVWIWPTAAQIVRSNVCSCGVERTRSAQCEFFCL
jgi:putative chitinase